jgi:hypothetical protein
MGRKSSRVYRKTSACFSAPEEFLIALTYGGESEWVKKVLADASLRLAA